jgi:hypothetical protein
LSFTAIGVPRLPAVGWLATIVLLRILSPSRAFDDRVPPENERGHETVHAQVVGDNAVGRLADALSRSGV